MGTNGKFAVLWGIRNLIFLVKFCTSPYNLNTGTAMPSIMKGENFMNEFKTITKNIYCNEIDKVCSVELKYQRIPRTGTYSNEAKLVSLYCSGSSYEQCSPEKCSLDSEVAQIISW